MLLASRTGNGSIGRRLLLRGLDFHGSPLATFEKDGERWVVMRPVVEGMGLAWTSQHAKLNAGADRYGVRNDIITRDGSDREQAMTCIPLRRYPMWLATINPAKIPNQAVRSDPNLFGVQAAGTDVLRQVAVIVVARLVRHGIQGGNRPGGCPRP